MNDEQPSSKQREKFSWRKLFIVLLIYLLVYAASYFADSFCGGYWMIPEMDGHDRYSFGLASPTAFLWQPRVGHEAIGSCDFLGFVYTPLIRVDRRFLHPTYYLSDENGYDEVTHLPVSKVHPEFRDDYLSDVKATAVCDNSNRVVQFTLRLNGSDRPRSITEVRMTREGATAWGVSPPKGLVEKPFEGYQKYQAENYIRWAGRIPLPRDRDVVLDFSVAHFTTNAAKIRFQCDLDERTKIDHAKICSVKIRNLSVSQPQN